MLLVAADSQRFHCAVNVVPDPARQSQRARLMVNKPAKAYTLHTSANNVTFGNHRKLLGPDLDYARERYAPSAVSTRIFSPSLMNGGTCTTKPVSVLAGLVTLDAVADFNPGSVCTTVNSTICGSSIPTALPS